MRKLRDSLKAWIIETWAQIEYIVRITKGWAIFEGLVLWSTYVSSPVKRRWIRAVVLPVRYARLWMAAKFSKKREAGAPTKPAPGWAWNPLLRYPRNLACYCGSGKKFKKCHEAREVRVVTKEKAEFLNGYLRAAGVA